MKVALAAILIHLIGVVLTSPAATNVSACDGAQTKGRSGVNWRGTSPQINGSEKRKAAGEKYYVLGTGSPGETRDRRWNII